MASSCAPAPRIGEHRDGEGRLDRGRVGLAEIRAELGENGVVSAFTRRGQRMREGIGVG
jgi:hypothetical protein